MTFSLFSVCTGSLLTGFTIDLESIVKTQGTQ